jgi:predicted transcriptional regulator of viral defense system
MSQSDGTICDMDASSITENAERQHGAMSSSQLRGLGITPKQIHRLIADRWLVPVRPGVFVVAGAPPTWHQAVMAAVLAAGPQAVASHSTAANLWGLPGVERAATELSTSRPDRRRLDGVVAHRTVAFLDCEHTTLERIPLTTVARTIVDLSGRFSVPKLGRMTDHGLRKGSFACPTFATASRAYIRRLAGTRTRSTAFCVDGFVVISQANPTWKCGLYARSLQPVCPNPFSSTG